MLDQSLAARLMERYELSKLSATCDAWVDPDDVADELLAAWPSISSALAALQSENARMREALQAARDAIDPPTRKKRFGLLEDWAQIAVARIDAALAKPEAK